VEVRPVDEQVLMVHFRDGEVLYRDDGTGPSAYSGHDYGPGDDELVAYGEELDTVAASETDGWALTSETDERYGPRGLSPMAVHRKSKVNGTDHDWNYKLDHWLFLRLPEPLIPHRRARFLSETRITVAPTATLLYGEIVQAGRKHHHPDECFGLTLLSLAVGAERPDGKTLFTEKLVIEPARRPLRQTGVMDSFDVFGNVVLLAPKDAADRVHARVDADVDAANGVAFGACHLPSDAGLIFKVLGRETAQVKAKVREFWGIAREETAGAAIPPPFFWR
jgi:hypothetical protein